MYCVPGYPELCRETISQKKEVESNAEIKKEWSDNKPVTHAFPVHCSQMLWRYVNSLMYICSLRTQSNFSVEQCRPTEGEKEE